MQALEIRPTAESSTASSKTPLRQRRSRPGPASSPRSGERPAAACRPRPASRAEATLAPVELAPADDAVEAAVEEAPAAAVETPPAAETRPPEPALDVFTVEAGSFGTYLPANPQTEVDGLQLYLREAGRSQLLTAEEEVRLAQEMEAGREARERLESERADRAELAALRAVAARGEAARQRLIGANLRLVVSLAKQHLGPGVEFSDLIQEGNLGLMRATDRFDWRKGNRFSTYALWWIRQAVSTAVSESSRPIRLPSHMMDTLSRLSKTEQRLAQELGRSPTDREVCQALGISFSRLADLRQIRERPSSLDVPIGEEGDAELADMVEDQVAPTPLNAILAASLRDQVDAVLATLDVREQRVICLRFGLEDDHPRTLEEVGRELRITKERVRQLEGRALRKLRHSTRSRWLVEYAE